LWILRGGAVSRSEVYRAGVSHEVVQLIRHDTPRRASKRTTTTERRPRLVAKTESNRVKSKSTGGCAMFRNVTPSPSRSHKQAAGPTAYKDGLQCLRWAYEGVGDYPAPWEGDSRHACVPSSTARAVSGLQGGAAGCRSCTPMIKECRRAGRRGCSK
jgi:hypothetical protein